MTYADKLRNMSDEELTNFILELVNTNRTIEELISNFTCGNCPYRDSNNKCPCDETDDKCLFDDKQSVEFWLHYDVDRKE